jgi:hypothetical protein
MRTRTVGELKLARHEEVRGEEPGLGLREEKAPRHAFWGAPSSISGWASVRKGGFTEAQRQVIIGYLEWYRDREMAEYSGLEVEPPAHVSRALAYWRGLRS